MVEWLMILIIIGGSNRPAATQIGPFATQELCLSAGAAARTVYAGVYFRCVQSKPLP